jgi:hypothetical protein
MHEEPERNIGFGGSFELRLILIVPVEGSPADDSGWLFGPAPFQAAGVTADIRARATYFDERVERALYGDEEAPRRWHQFHDTQETPSRSGFQPEAAELISSVAGNGSDGLLIIHGGCAEDLPPKALFELSRLPEGREGLRSWIDEIAGPGVETRSDIKRVFISAFATPQAELVKRYPSEYADWSASEENLWLLASATPLEIFPPVPTMIEELRTSAVELSRDWIALVLRDGAAFLGLREDKGAQDPFFRSAELYFHSIYLDALLLGMLQRINLVAIANDLAELGDPAMSPRAVRLLERRLSVFRNVYWWTHLSGHGAANSLNLAYGRQHRLPELCAQVTSETSEYSQQAQTAAANRTNSLLGVITVVGLPIGVVIGVFQTLKLESKASLIVSSVLAVLITLIAVVIAGRVLLARDKNSGY